MVDRKLSNRSAAERIRLKAPTWRAYVARGLAPQPDGREEVSGTPWWWESTIDAWLASRLGQGFRSDRCAPVVCQEADSSPPIQA